MISRQLIKPILMTRLRGAEIRLKGCVCGFGCGLTLLGRVGGFISDTGESEPLFLCAEGLLNIGVVKQVLPCY